MKTILLGIFISSSALATTFNCKFDKGEIEYFNINTNEEVVLLAQDFEGQDVNFADYTITTSTIYNGHYILISLKSETQAPQYFLNLSNKINSNTGDYLATLSQINLDNGATSFATGKCLAN